MALKTSDYGVKMAIFFLIFFQKNSHFNANRLFLEPFEKTKLQRLKVCSTFVDLCL